MTTTNFFRRATAGAAALLASGSLLLAAVPNAPDGLYAYAKADPANNYYSIVFQWKANPTGDAATGFKIYEREENSSDWSLLADRPADENSYTIDQTMLSLKDHLYYFYVAAYNADGESAGNTKAVVSFKEQSQPPVGGILAFTSYPDMKLQLGNTFTYDADVKSDLDGTVSFALIAAPDGATIDAATGLVQWTPTAAGVYKFALHAVLAGQQTAEATQEWVVYVYDTNIPTDPGNTVSIEFTSSPKDKAAIGQEYSYDADVKWEGKGTLTYKLDYAPDGAIIDPATGIVRWTPTEEGYVKMVVTAQVTDRGKVIAEASQGWAIEVLPEGSDVKSGGIVADVKDVGTASRALTYPNPAISTVTVEFEGTEGGAHVAVYDMNGTVIYSDIVHSVQGKNTFTLDTHAFSAGQYYMQIISGGKKATTPVRVTR